MSRLIRFCCILLLLCCGASCNRLARQLEVEDVLPPGYKERVVPEFYKEAFGDIAYAPGVWTRCFDCDLDWKGLKDHLRLNPNMLGYTDSTEEWFKIWGDNEAVEAMREFTRAYSSPQGSYHVFVFHLKGLRQQGLEMGTGGDYIITCGPDRFEFYE